MTPERASSSEGLALLQAEGLIKSFGETRALSDASLTIRPHSVHAVIGENGSGKSTLVKLLTGVMRPDSGSITLAERGRVDLASPRQARAAGIATTFQEILVLKDLSVLDNLWLGQDRLFSVTIPDTRKRAEASAMLAELLGADAPPLDARVGLLDLGTQQAIVIARSLLLAPRLLILDEATAALDIAVRDRVFEAVKRRVAAGLSVLFITHKMDEIAALADTVTVLRSGKTVATMPIAEATPARMLELMSGRSEALSVAGIAGGGGPTQLSVAAARLAPDSAPFNLAVRSGEILGLAGLEGHGADLMAQVLGGVGELPAGEVRSAAGATLHTPRAFVDVGVAYVPRDRKLDGILAPLSIADNFSIATLGRYTRFGMLDPSRIASARAPLFERLRVKFGALGDSITSMSGGNQQKVILARMLALGPKVLVLNDPTRGVDLATKQDIYALLADQAAAGVSVVVHSTEIEELLALCGRVAVFHDNTLFGVLEGAALSREALIAGLFGRAA